MSELLSLAERFVVALERIAAALGSETTTEPPVEAPAFAGTNDELVAEMTAKLQKASK